MADASRVNSPAFLPSQVKMKQGQENRSLNPAKWDDEYIIRTPAAATAFVFDICCSKTFLIERFSME